MTTHGVRNCAVSEICEVILEAAKTRLEIVSLSLGRQHRLERKKLGERGGAAPVISDPRRYGRKLPNKIVPDRRIAAADQLRRLSPLPVWKRAYVHMLG